MSNHVRKRILLVEDEAILAVNEKMQLEKYEYDVRTVPTGEKAVEAVKESAEIDLILMDINLGNGLDGTEAAEIILKDRHIPIVFLSSHTDPKVVEKTEKITSYGYVVKNSNIAVLDASIKMAFKLFDAQRILSKKEAALSYKHDFMSYVIEHSSSAIAVHDRELNYLYVSQQYLDSYRVKEREVIGRHHYEVFPDLPQKWRDAHQRALRGEVLRAEDDPFEREDGRIDWTRWECRPWYEQDGAIGGIIVYTEVIQRGSGQVRYVHERCDHERDELGAIIQSIGMVQDITDRKQVEEELRRFKTISDNAVYGKVSADLDGNPHYIAASAVDMSSRFQAEEKYQSLFNSSNDAIFVHEIGTDGVPGRIIEVNDQACKLSQYSREELLQMSMSDIASEQTRSLMPSRTKELLEQKHLTFEAEDLRRDGSIVPVEVSAFSYRKGGKDFVVSSVRDITERKQVEHELTSQKQYLERILETTSDGFWVVTPDKRITNVNTAYCRMSGYSPEELASMRINDLDALEDFPETAERVKRIITNGSETFQTRHRRKDGSTFNVEVSATHLDRDDGAYLVCFCRDITARLQIDRNLQDVEELNHALFDQVLTGIYVMNKTGKFIVVNEEACRQSGYTRDELLGMTVFELNERGADTRVVEHETLLESWSRVTPGDQHVFQTKHVRKDGTAYPVLISARAIRHENEMVFATAVIDITEWVEAKNQIRTLATENETLLRELQHRIKNNLNTMTSLLSLQAQTLTEPAAIEALVYARNRLHSLGLLYDHLYCSGTYKESSLREYLSQLVTSEVRLFPRGEQVEIHSEIDEYVCPAETLSTLGLIVNELVTNAMKYAFPDHPNPELTITGVRHDLQYVLTVGDNGTGPCEPVQRNPSTGSGTMIVDALTEALDGTIKTENAKGTRVTVTFPIAVQQ